MTKERDRMEITPAADGEKAQATKQTAFDWDQDPYPPTHNFEIEPIIEGKVTMIGYVTIKGREAYYLHIKTKEGEETVWAGTVLLGRMSEEKLLSGDMIGIKYLGDKKGDKENPYKDYDIRVIKQATPKTFVSDEV